MRGIAFEFGFQASRCSGEILLKDCMSCVCECMNNLGGGGRLEKYPAGEGIQ